LSAIIVLSIQIEQPEAGSRRRLDALKANVLLKTF